MTAVIITGLLLIIFGAAYVFLALPRITDSADMELQSSDYARGGLWGNGIPENSFPAIIKAITCGYGIELDVTLSRNQKPIVISKDRASLLAEILELVDGRVSVMIHLEASGRIGVLCRAVTRVLDGYDGAFAIVSSNTDVLVWFRKYRPRFARGFILFPYKALRKNSKAKHPLLSSFVRANMLTNFICRPDFISADGARRKSLPLLLFNKMLGIPCFVRNVGTPAAYKEARSKGMFAVFEKTLPKNQINNIKRKRGTS